MPKPKGTPNQYKRSKLDDVVEAERERRRERQRVYRRRVRFGDIATGETYWRGHGGGRKPIDPGVLAASYQELIAAGWENYERHLIPADWRTRGPKHAGGTVECNSGKATSQNKK